MKKMPTPVNDMVLAQQRNPEKTEAAIQRVGSISPLYVGGNRQFYSYSYFSVFIVILICYVL